MAMNDCVAVNIPSSPSFQGWVSLATAGNGKDDTHSFPLFCLMSESLMRIITLVSINTPCKKEKY